MSLLNNLGSGNDNPSYRFAKPGDTLVGTIVEKPRQVTTKTDEGKEREQAIFTVDIIRDKCVSHRKQKNNDGTVTLEAVDLTESDTWTLWVPLTSRLATAVKQAAQAAKATDFNEGDLISVTLTGYGDPFKPGYAPPGLYTAVYKVAAPAAAEADPFDGLI
jgi:hypothetical protein